MSSSSANREKLASAATNSAPSREPTAPANEKVYRTRSAYVVVDAPNTMAVARMTEVLRRDIWCGSCREEHLTVAQSSCRVK